MIKKFINNPWVVGIATGIIVLIGGSLFGLINWSIVFNWIVNIFTWSLNINGILFIILLLASFYIGKNLVISSTRTTNVSSTQDDNINPNFNSSTNYGPDFLQYTGDKFENINYRWEWRFEKIRNAYVVYDIAAHCPKCDCRLLETYCPNCKEGYYGAVKDSFEVEALIHHRIDTDMYKNRTLTNMR